MILAVMQPYLFPYLGYFQLAASADQFVFLDDVAYIKKGFINRNRILLGGQPYSFSIAVERASQNRRIDEHRFTGAFDTFLAQVRHAYHRAPFFAEVFALVEAVCRAPELNVAVKNAASVQAVFDYLGVPLASRFASALPVTVARGEQRILDLCQHFGAHTYHNASGGQMLYDGQRFAARGVRLRFLRNRFAEYGQSGGAFVPGLSIIDVLMHNERERVCEMLLDFDLLEAA
ncbi:WbqC family protein [Ectopseudomonas chengduensis]